MSRHSDKKIRGSGERKIEETGNNKSYSTIDISRINPQNNFSLKPKTPSLTTKNRENHAVQASVNYEMQASLKRLETAAERISPDASQTVTETSPSEDQAALRSWKKDKNHFHLDIKLSTSM